MAIEPTSVEVFCIEEEFAPKGFLFTMSTLPVVGDFITSGAGTFQVVSREFMVKGTTIGRVFIRVKRA